MASSVTLEAALLYSQETISIFTTNYYVHGSAITVSLI